MFLFKKTHILSDSLSMVHNKVIKYKCLQSGVRVIQSENPEKQVRGISILRSSIHLILLEK